MITFVNEKALKKYLTDSEDRQFLFHVIETTAFFLNVHELSIACVFSSKKQTDTLAIAADLESSQYLVVFYIEFINDCMNGEKDQEKREKKYAKHILQYAAHELQHIYNSHYHHSTSEHAAKNAEAIGKNMFGLYMWYRDENSTLGYDESILTPTEQKMLEKK